MANYTPANVVDKLNAAINDSLKTSEEKEGLAKLSALPQAGSPQEFGARSEIAGE
jgi:tripartite-type tricarboxylate transporter receptor subunit TctC